jgi:hypothetical protein
MYETARGICFFTSAAHVVVLKTLLQKTNRSACFARAPTPPLMKSATLQFHPAASRWRDGDGREMQNADDALAHTIALAANVTLADKQRCALLILIFIVASNARSTFM